MQRSDLNRILNLILTHKFEIFAPPAYRSPFRNSATFARVTVS